MWLQSFILRRRDKHFLCVCLCRAVMIRQSLQKLMRQCKDWARLVIWAGGCGELLPPAWDRAPVIVHVYTRAQFLKIDFALRCTVSTITRQRCTVALVWHYGFEITAVQSDTKWVNAEQPKQTFSFRVLHIRSLNISFTFDCFWISHLFLFFKLII